MSEDPAADGAGRVAAVFAGLLDHWVAASPVTATQLGDHSRDGELDDWSPATADERLRAVSALRARLGSLDAQAVDAEVAGDALLLADALDAMEFELAVRRSHACDPLFFLGLATGAVHELIRRDDLDPGPLRPALAARAAQVPRLLRQAQELLTEVSAPHREVALLRLPGAQHLFAEVLPQFAPSAADAGRAAAAACASFGAWLSDHDGPSPDWRLGADRWSGALRLALGVRMAPDELFTRAQQRRAELQDRMEDLSRTVLGDGAGLSGPDLVRAGVAAASVDQSRPADLVIDAAAVLTDIREFIRQWGDFALPEPDTLRVEEVPPFMQGVAVAYFVPAPPLETDAPHTYYLSPVPDSWESEQVASFLREYNIHALRSVGIHEAYPGHYVQLAFAQRHPRLLRRALWNSAFAEGWAVYVERQMIAAGFGDAYGDADGARMRLISAKMEMRSLANALLDQGLHIQGWSDEHALSLMVDATYQEPAEAQAKLLRGKVTAGQLSTYFVGGEEMDDLRDDVRAARGTDFSAAAFHADVLAQGTPPFPVLRRALLGET